MVTNLIDYYDEEKWGVSHAPNRVLFQREKKCIKIIQEMSSPLKLLDIGCGDGFFLSELSKSYTGKQDFWGLDYSEYKLSKAKKMPFKYKQGNIEDGLPFKDNEFDVVYAGELIEHLYNPDKFLEECKRILKKDGRIIISTPNLNCWYNRILFLFGLLPMFYEVSTKSPLIGSSFLRHIKKGQVPVGHVRIFNVRSLKDILEQEGFIVENIKGANFTALPEPLKAADGLFNIYPRLASNLVISARSLDKK